MASKSMADKWKDFSSGTPPSIAQNPHLFLALKAAYFGGAAAIAVKINDLILAAATMPVGKFQSEYLALLAEIEREIAGMESRQTIPLHTDN